MYKDLRDIFIDIEKEHVWNKWRRFISLFYVYIAAVAFKLLFEHVIG